MPSANTNKKKKKEKLFQFISMGEKLVRGKHFDCPSAIDNIHVNFIHTAKVPREWREIAKNNAFECHVMSRIKKERQNEVKSKKINKIYLENIDKVTGAFAKNTRKHREKDIMMLNAA